MIFDLQIFQNTRTGVAKHLVGGGQNAGGLPVAEHAHQVRVRFVVAIVDPIGSRTITAAPANVVTDAAVISEFDVETLAISASQRFR